MVRWPRIIAARIVVGVEGGNRPMAMRAVHIPCPNKRLEAG